VQVHNDSIKHEAEHPSFPALFVSSHCSFPAMAPSPQTVMQAPLTTLYPFRAQAVQTEALEHDLHPAVQAVQPLELSK
jgi:hypothetical protein